MDTESNIAAGAPPPAPKGEGVERHYPLLFRYLVRSLRSGTSYGLARDLVQDVYLRFLSLPHREQVRQPRAYLLRIASNLIMEYRLRERSAPVVFDSELAEGHIEGETQEVWRDALGESLGLLQALDRVLATMPPSQRAVTVLWVREGLSADAIAQRTGFTAKTVRKYLTRALAQLRASRVEV